MMKLSQLLNKLSLQKVAGESANVVISGIASDSRQVLAGDLFVALKGEEGDGHSFIPDALRRGAVAVILEDDACWPASAPDVPFFLVADSRQALVRVADAFFAEPLSRLRVIGVTGTNGKTTVTYLLKGILEAAGRPTGVIGTIGYQLRESRVTLKNTTPGIVELRRIFSEMAAEGDQYVAMEVSSHALQQDRVAGIPFCAAVFTNLTQDHLDYHKDIEHYFEAKKKLFCECLGPRTWALINVDQAYGSRLAASCAARVLTYGLASGDVRGEDAVLSSEGSRMRIVARDIAFEVRTKLIGRHNLYNVLSAAAAGISQGLDPSAIQRGIQAVERIPGRLERVEGPSDFIVFVDYAHTDDALKNVLESLRAIVHNGRIITVFGCGGDRDRLKRPLMGRVACALSDHCVITSDNPRHEDPGMIIQDILKGVETTHYSVEVDRGKAIALALSMARAGDLVLVAGKGHETTQLIGSEAVPFDDVQVVRQYFGGSKGEHV